MKTLSTEDIGKSYGGRQVVRGVSLELEQGEVVGLLGPNGAGKTTSFYMIVGLLRPDAGRIFLEGQEVTDLPMYRRCRLGMGYLPQESSVFRKLTVEENLLAILEMLDLSHGARNLPRREVLALVGRSHETRTPANATSRHDAAPAAGHPAAAAVDDRAGAGCPKGARGKSVARGGPDGSRGRQQPRDGSECR